MNKPIIDPSTLTEEQRKAIRRENNHAKRIEVVGYGSPYLRKRTPWLRSPYLRGRFRMLQDIFGKEFLRKENDMDNEKIKELANELARRLYNDDKAYNSILWWGNEPKERKAEELELTLEFLLETHCIVEKDQARELARLTLEHGGSDAHGLIDGLVDWVCFNFDEEYREEAEK